MPEHENQLYAAIAAEVARNTHPSPAIEVGDDVIETMLMTLTQGLVDAVPAAVCASVTLVEHGQVVSIAATDPTAQRIDDLQATHDTGPCLMSAWTQRHITIADYTTEHRWPSYAADVVAHTPVRATMSFELYRQPESMAALNLHAAQPHVFDNTTTALGYTFATQAALALHAEARVEQFRSALASRDLIGQAKGILMQQYNIDADAAFNLLSRLSQDTNTKITDIAGRLVTLTPTNPADNPDSAPPR